MFLLTCVFYKGNILLMKLASINNSVPNRAYNNKKTSPSFKGLTQGIINFWQFVDNHGRAMQFTVEDMTGTNLPRSYKGLMAGKKYTGHFNLPAFFQEAIREFLTGPTMCTVPFAVMWLAKKSGNSADTRFTNIRNLSYIMENTNIQEGQNLEDVFYQNVVKDMYSKTISKDIADDKIQSMVDIFKRFAKEGDKKERSNILNEAQREFEHVIKSSLDDYGNTNFINAKYSKNASMIGETKFKDYLGYATAYCEDFTKKTGKKVTQELIDNFKSHIDNFKKINLGKRAVVVGGGMMALTGILMSQIPKWYTKASGKINPNAKAIYEEAGKQKNAAKENK